MAIPSSKLSYARRMFLATKEKQYTRQKWAKKKRKLCDLSLPDEINDRLQLSPPRKRAKRSETNDSSSSQQSQQTQHSRLQPTNISAFTDITNTNNTNRVNNVSSTTHSTMNTHKVSKPNAPNPFLLAKSNSSKSITNQMNKSKSNKSNKTSFTNKSHRTFRSLPPSDDPLVSTLRQRFGYHSFRNSQRDAIQCIFNKQDVLVLMPTGGGKSLCFQIPPLIHHKLAIVISPLLALMKNHCDCLQRKNINAQYINSTVPAATKRSIISDLSSNSSSNSSKKRSIELLYTTPETLQTNGELREAIVSLARNQEIALFAIDECHCISSWGHDFRAAYRSLSSLRSNYPGIPIMALTATATRMVRDDIVRNLRMYRPKVIITGFDRPNLYFTVKYIEHLPDPKPMTQPATRTKSKKRKKRSRKIDAAAITKVNRKIGDDIYKFIARNNYQRATGLIYVYSRKDAETMAQYLKKEYKLSIEGYHAGMSNKKKVEIQEKWENGTTKG